MWDICSVFLEWHTSGKENKRKKLRFYIWEVTKEGRSICVHVLECLGTREALPCALSAKFCFGCNTIFLLLKSTWLLATEDFIFLRDWHLSCIYVKMTSLVHRLLPVGVLWTHILVCGQASCEAVTGCICTYKCSLKPGGMCQRQSVYEVKERVLPAFVYCIVLERREYTPPCPLILASTKQMVIQVRIELLSRRSVFFYFAGLINWLIHLTI